ncbi:MAG: helix-turn-helix domain-containing protein [Phycisphaerales bacterium]
MKSGPNQSLPKAGTGEEASRQTEELISVSVPKAAAMVGLSERKTWDLVADGTIPSLRVGRRVLIPVAGLRAWIKGGCS